MNKFIFIAALTAAMLAQHGCKHAKVDSKTPYPIISKQSTQTTTGRSQALTIVERICNIDSLRAERDDRIKEARNLIIAGYDQNTASDSREGGLKVTQAPYGKRTERTELVRSFEIDLDAAYRFASTSCQTYAMCMQMNMHDEARCDKSRVSWEGAQTRFVETSKELSDIRKQIATHRFTGKHAHKGHHGHGKNTSKKKSCKDDIGGIFTTSC